MMLDKGILLGKKRWYFYIQQGKSSSKFSHHFHKLVMEFLLLDIDILQEFVEKIQTGILLTNKLFGSLSTLYWLCSSIHLFINNMQQN